MLFLSGPKDTNLWEACADDTRIAVCSTGRENLLIVRLILGVANALYRAECESLEPDYQAKT